VADRHETTRVNSHPHLCGDCCRQPLTWVRSPAITLRASSDVLDIADAHTCEIVPEFRLVDESTKETLESHSDVDQARARREVLQGTRKTRVVIRKVRLPDLPIPKPAARTGSSAHRDRTLATRAHFAPSEDRLPRLEASRGFSRDLLEQALTRLDERLKSGPWNWDAYRKIRRRYRATPRNDGGAPVIDCEGAELALVRILADTYPYNQFSVTPTGDVFVGQQHGYHRKSARLYVTRLSPILDEAADLLLARSLGEGGRLYVHSTVIERANDRGLLASLHLSP
jgi:hypothetical protein